METGAASKRRQENAEPQLHPVTYRMNWSIVFLLILGNLGFIAIGVYLVFFSETGNSKDLVIGWLCIVFFGLTLTIHLADCFIRGPILIVDSEGLWDKRISPIPIPWAQVRRAYIRKVKLTKFLCLDLANPEAYLPSPLSFRGIFARLNAAVGFAKVTISTLPLTGQAEEILATIERFSAQAVEESSSSRR